MSVACVTRQLGALGNFSQLLESLPCAVGIIPHLLRVLRQDLRCLAEFLGPCQHTNKWPASVTASGRVA